MADPPAACLVFLPVLWLSGWIPPPGGHAWFELRNAGTGSRIAAELLPDTERIVLTWKNSLFGWLVAEVLAANRGIPTLTPITFTDPTGREPHA